MEPLPSANKSTPYALIEHQYDKHAQALVEIAQRSGELLEGNLFTHHLSYDRWEAGIRKRNNLFILARRCQRVLEVGFNAGHSALLFLLADPRVDVVAVDCCTHKYTVACVDYLNSHFHNRVRLVAGNSLVVLPRLLSKGISSEVPLDFDLFHIDGGHSRAVACSDMLFCRRMAKHNAFVVLDDTNVSYLATLWQQYISNGYIVAYWEDDLRSTVGSTHQMGRFHKHCV